jgi:hypothetical protein
MEDSSAFIIIIRSIYLSQDKCEEIHIRERERERERYTTEKEIDRQKRERERERAHVISKNVY